MARYIDADKLFLNFNDWAFAESPDERHSDVPEYSEHKIHEMIYRTINEAMSAIEQQPTADVPQWIPCSERLPSTEDSYNVLCCDKYGEIMIGHVFGCDDGETPYSAESECEYMYDCVAWMPLPEPWKGEAK